LLVRSLFLSCSLSCSFSLSLSLPFPLLFARLLALSVSRTCAGAAEAEALLTSVEARANVVVDCLGALHDDERDRSALTSVVRERGLRDRCHQLEAQTKSGVFHDYMFTMVYYVFIVIIYMSYIWCIL